MKTRIGIAVMALAAAALALTGCAGPNGPDAAKIQAAIHQTVLNGITDFNQVMTSPAVSNAVTAAIGNATKAP